MAKTSFKPTGNAKSIRSRLDETLDSQSVADADSNGRLAIPGDYVGGAILLDDHHDEDVEIIGCSDDHNGQRFFQIAGHATAAPEAHLFVPAVHSPFHGLPSALTNEHRWVLWRYQSRNGKRTKVPYTTSGLLAKSTDPTTWASSRDALIAHHISLYDGVGFVLGDGFAGVDFDHVRNPATGGIEPWVRRMIDRLGSYAEISPSGEGIHVLVRGSLPKGGRKFGGVDVELYDTGRYFTITADRFNKADVEERADELATLHADLSELKKLFGRFSKKRGDVVRLFRGQALADYGGDESRADLALVSYLARHTRDPNEIDRLFRLSGLSRDKWINRPDYRERIIEAALGGLDNDTAATAATATVGGSRSVGTSKRPEIVISTEVTQVVDAAENALIRADVGVFQRTGELVRVVRTGPPCDKMNRSICWQPDTPLIGIAPTDWLWERIAATAAWKHYDAKKDETRPVLPPPWVGKTLAARGSWRFPHLTGVITAPTARADGSMLDRPGYDPATGLFFEPLGETFPTIPSTPDSDDVTFSMDALDDVLHDFPFAAPNDRIDPRASCAAAIAALLTLLARDAFRGPAPMFSITAPTAGTGKSLLAQVIGTIGTGRDPGVWAPPESEAELRKELLTIGIEGAQAVVFDNVSGSFRSDSLAAALTTERLHGRILGVSREATVPLRTVFMLTGNNVQTVGDLARRVVPIHLDASVEQPEERTGFEHGDLANYVRDHRPKLVVAGLTLLRAYHTRGRPQERVSAFGSFTGWSSFIRQATMQATKVAWGEPIDPCAGRIAIRDLLTPSASC